MPVDANTKIYSATYSNVPVYEFNADGNLVMRRRVDDWINATHILKVADFDKPARTRILEREVQKGVHEKVQGGYGKYQGTWVPLPDGRGLAERNGVLHKLQPILDYVPGEHSPPPAPKHATASSAKPKAPRQKAAPKVEVLSQISEDRYEMTSAQFDDVSDDARTVVTNSVIEDDGMRPPFTGSARKRKRGADHMSVQDQQHQIWADQLLDYFMLLESDDRFPAPPEPPPGVNLDRPIDEKGHSAMHWAAAMGDFDVVQDLMNRAARIDCLSNNFETPLMRAVMFTNNFDKNTMPRMVRTFASTVAKTDWFGSSVFHHIAATTSSKNKYVSARYYLDCIINVLSETWSPDDITRLLNLQDQNGDTAIIIAARNGARKLVRALLGRNASVDIRNQLGETADDLIRDLNIRRQNRNGMRQASSSPFAPDSQPNGNAGALLPTSSSAFNTIQSTPHYRSQTANTLMQKIAPNVFDRFSQLATAYDGELEEKDVELVEAQRVLRKRQAELDVIRKRLSELEPLDEGDEIDKRQEEELASLMMEAEAILEMEQKAELKALLEKEKAASSNAKNNHESNKENPGAIADGAATSGVRGGNGKDDDGNVIDRVTLALMLQKAQETRRKLIKEIVQKLSVAGMSERQSDYKRLITGALGVKEEDVEGMLNEILAELEDAKERDTMEVSPV
ncbi:apses-domain-containing protein, partial [Eremomyces bilateralis CBS 781.70]